MRVVSGQFRGRRLVSPEGRDTRPTTEKVREAVFNALIVVSVIGIAGTSALAFRSRKGRSAL